MKNLHLLLLTFFLFTASTAPALRAEEADLREETYQNLEVFANVLMLLQQHYVDTIDPQEVITGAINGMLTSLDPHSAYMNAEDFKELQEETHGSFSGIGIEITVKENILTVVSPIEDTPAFRAGLMAGDQIIAIDGAMTKNMTLLEAVKKLRGKKGSSVTITIHRAGWQETKDFAIVRDEIPLHSVKSMELQPNLFYVRIANFQANTARDLIDALHIQQKKGAISGLLLDLRNNPGGLLDQAVQVADVFLDSGVIVSTKGRDAEQDLLFEASADDEHYRFPIIVLVNSGSASASEIVAGALQDHGRAIILGTVTFGKGSVQTIVPMPDGAGLRLTTAKYYTPSGTSIQATGIRPDINVDFTPPPPKMETEKNGGGPLREQDLPNHFENEAEKDSKKKGKEGEFAKGELTEAEERLQNDNQLRTALYIMKGLQIAAQSKEKGKKEKPASQTP
ncbi:MAG: S41 family peptidase [Desulfobulbaceae bacterium]